MQIKKKIKIAYSLKGKIILTENPSRCNKMDFVYKLYFNTYAVHAWYL